MIKKFLAVCVIAVAMTSCGGPSPAEYDQAAKNICDCMEEKDAEAAAEPADDSGFNLDMSDLNYGLCALDAVIEVRVDMSNEQMQKSMESTCPDLAEAHAEYAKEL